GDIISITAYRESETTEFFSFSATDFSLLPSFNPFFPFQQLADNFEKPSTFSQELRLVSTKHNRLSYVAGIYYFKDDVERDAGSIRLAGLTGNTIRDLIYDQEVDTTSFAFYTDIEYEISNTLTANFGGRYTIEEKEVQVDFIDNLNVDNNFSSPRFDERWNEFTPRVSLNWQPTKNLIVYGSFTQGFTSGGFNTEGNNNEVIGRAFDPETIDAFEVGIKGDFFDNRLRANLSVFTQDYKDKQEGVLNTNFDFVIVNASQADVDGVEIETTFVLNDYITLSGNYAYLDARYSEFFIEQRDGTFDDRSGNFLASSPKNSMNLSINGYYPMGSGELTGSINYSWQNDYFTGSENRDTFLIDSFSVVNAHISYETNEQWRFTLWANNLTDEEYLLIRSDFGDVIGIGEHYAMPRTYGIRIAKVFDAF
ncbi:MAG: TonB-dependent receptor, partial [Pseudomonadota bacterium]